MTTQALPENAQAAMSYAVGGMAVTTSLSLADVATTSQQLAIVFALVVVILRVVHDTVRLIRYLKDRPHE